MATPRCFKSAISPKSRSAASSNSELVGSSIRMTRASMLSARAIASNCIWPMESDAALLRMLAGRSSPPAPGTAGRMLPCGGNRRIAIPGNAGCRSRCSRRCCQVGKQVELLINDADAQRAARRRGLEMAAGRPSMRDGAAIGPDAIPPDLREGAFARAVLAHERVNFARPAAKCAPFRASTPPKCLRMSIASSRSGIRTLKYRDAGHAVNGPEGASLDPWNL